MFRRAGAVVTVAAAAAGGPYLASETEWGRQATSRVAGLTQPIAKQDTPSIPAANAHHEVETLRPINATKFRYEPDLARKLTDSASPDVPTQPSLVGARVADLREVLRFDIDSQWVTHRFSRVSTVLADLNLQGLRVPIVTGTKADDLAGTLTYYFDHSGRLQRVTVHGFTGTPAQLVSTLAQHYGLTAEPNLEAGVYTRRWNGVPIHFLRLTYAPVVYSDAVHQKYTVFLELNQPDLPFGISREAQQIVATDQHSGRW